MRINHFILKLTLFIFWSVISQASFAQENFLPGYVISSKGDTVKGLIDYRNWINNPEKIFFKTDVGSASVFKPIDIKEFKVLDEIYVSGIVEIEVSKTDTKKLDFNSSFQIETDTVFLQTMIRGEKSLYFFENSQGVRNFYIKRNSDFDLLKYKKYLIKQGQNTAVAENKKYVNQLSVYLNACASIQSELGKTEYKHKDLENLFNSYYECGASEIEFQKKREDINTEFGILTGLSLTSLNFKSESIAYLDETNFSKSLNFTAGVFIDIIFPRSNNKWSLNNELTIASYKVEGHHLDFDSESIYTNSFTEFNYTYLKMNNMIRYHYPYNAILVFINAGISNGFRVAGDDSRIAESMYYSVENTREYKALEDSRRLEQGLLVGLGTKFKNYSVEIRAERGNGMSKISSLKSSTSRLYCLLGYRF